MEERFLLTRKIRSDCRIPSPKFSITHTISLYDEITTKIRAFSNSICNITRGPEIKIAGCVRLRDIQQQRRSKRRLNIEEHPNHLRSLRCVSISTSTHIFRYSSFLLSCDRRRLMVNTLSRNLTYPDSVGRPNFLLLKNSSQDSY